ncbi:T-cell receptor beta chain V region CTL-L17 [Sciurus carolinensis]|nr:T-cell receptor beta chain V region CTL-L17 [Sciurus carolinensis]
MLRPVPPDSAWGPRLLCCITLCLLGAGSVDAVVTQSPRHLIKAKGGKGTLKCYPMSGHNSVSWYQQAPAQGPQFLVEYYEKLQRSKGNFPDRFSAQQFGDYHSELNMSTLQLGDSATYLCASSLHSPAESLAFCTQTFLSPLSVFQGEEVWVATQTEPRPMHAPSSWLALCLPC